MTTTNSKKPYPDSLLTSVKGLAFSRAVARIPETYWELSDDEIQDLARPTATDHRLRISFWNAITSHEGSNTPVDAALIYAPVCTYTHWHVGVLGNTKKLAWLLRPVRQYEELLTPLLQKAAERYADILALDVHDEHGKPIPELAKIVWEAIKGLEVRTRRVPREPDEQEPVNEGVGELSSRGDH